MTRRLVALDLPAGPGFVAALRRAWDDGDAVLPLAHVGGLSVVTRALVLGTGLTVLPTFDPEAVPAATRVSLVPTQLRRADPETIARFRTVLLGGAAPPDELPANVVVTYGMTETGSGVVYDGRPLDGVEVRVDDGELLVRGPMLLRCYRDGTDPRIDGWLRTGDGGRIVDGRVVVDGRIGDVIVTGGEKVWPDPVEEALRSHPAVADVAVAGTPDPEWGALVTAFVVARTEPPDLATLRDHVTTTLPPYAAPRRVVAVASIPRTVSGKPRRDVLRRSLTGG